MNRVTLEAPEGMLYTNGKIYGSVIHLAKGIDGANFRLTTKEEYEQILDIESMCETDGM